MAETLIAIVGLAGFVSVANGLLVLAFSGMFSSRSRKTAIPLLAGLFATAGCALVLDFEGKAIEQSGERSDEIVAGCIFILVWLCAVIWYFRQKSRAVGIEKGEEQSGRSLNSLRLALLEKLQSKMAPTEPIAPPVRSKRTPKPKPTIDYDRNWPSKRRGKSVSFEYFDAEGVITERTVANWYMDDGYLKGHCLLRDAHRKFCLDRVLQWHQWH